MRNLAGLDLADPEGMVIAPSTDQTDEPSTTSVYVADSGGGATQASGTIVELSLAPLATPAAIDFTSQLVRTVDMGRYTPQPRPLGDHARPRPRPRRQRRGGRGDRQRDHALPGRERLGAEPERGRPAHGEHLECSTDRRSSRHERADGDRLQPEQRALLRGCGRYEEDLRHQPRRTASWARPTIPRRSSTRMR